MNFPDAACVQTNVSRCRRQGADNLPPSLMLKFPKAVPVSLDDEDARPGDNGRAVAQLDRATGSLTNLEKKSKLKLLTLSTLHRF